MILTIAAIHKMNEIQCNFRKIHTDRTRANIHTNTHTQLCTAFMLKENRARLQRIDVKNSSGKIICTSHWAHHYFNSVECINTTTSGRNKKRACNM